MGDSKHSIYRVQVLDRACEILDALASRTEECSLSELSADVGLHKSTVHRIVMALEIHGMVQKNSKTGRYRLGIKLFELASRAPLSRPRLLDAAEMVYSKGADESKPASTQPLPSK